MVCNQKDTDPWFSTFPLTICLSVTGAVIIQVCHTHRIIKSEIRCQKSFMKNILILYLGTKKNYNDILVKGRLPLQT